MLGEYEKEKHILTDFLTDIVRVYQMLMNIGGIMLLIIQMMCQTEMMTNRFLHVMTLENIDL